MTDTPRGAPELVSGQAIPEVTVNEAIRHTEAGACFFPIVDKDLTAPPGACADGACYIVGAAATGLWSGKTDQIATAVGTNAASGWLYHAELEGLFGYVQDENKLYYNNGTAWGEFTPTPGAGTTAWEMLIAVSDETTALTTGTAKVTFRMPRAVTLTDVRASVTTAPTGSTLIVDINEGGSTILSTKLSIDASEKTSTTAASAAVISDTALADDAEMTINIDQVGSTIAGAGLKVLLKGTI